MLFCRDWPKPVLLKEIPSDNKLGHPVWDPRVSLHILVL